MKHYILLGLAPLFLIACDARVNTAAPGPDKVIEKSTVIVTPAAEKTEKTTTTTTETKK